MAPLPPAGAVIKVDLYDGSGLDVNGLNRLHFSYSGGPPSTADCTSLATSIGSAYGTYMKALFSNSGGLGQTSVVDLSSGTGAGSLITTLQIGTRGTAYLPAGAAVLVNHKIARRYRGGKPRTYFAAFVSGDMASPSAWASASVTAFQTGFNNFISHIVGATAGSTTITGFVNVSYYHAGALRGTPLVEAITSSVVSPLPASQRRRNRP